MTRQPPLSKSGYRPPLSVSGTSERRRPDVLCANRVRARLSRGKSTYVHRDAGQAAFSDKPPRKETDDFYGAIFIACCEYVPEQPRCNCPVTNVLDSVMDGCSYAIPAVSEISIRLESAGARLSLHRTIPSDNRLPLREGNQKLLYFRGDQETPDRTRGRLCVLRKNRRIGRRIGDSVLY